MLSTYGDFMYAGILYELQVSTSSFSTTVGTVAKVGGATFGMTYAAGLTVGIVNVGL